MDEFENLISRRQYNDCRKLLFEMTEVVRKSMAERLNKQADVFAIDSMLLEICKITREQRNQMGKESIEHSPEKGYCASQKKYFYGYKLYSICLVSGVIQSLNLIKARVHDIHYLKDVQELFDHCIITGNRGYVSKQHQINLYETARIQLEAPLRNNQKEQKPVVRILKKVRKRIETVFSQLCDQFMIQRNYAKSFAGFRYRIITGFTILQFLNKFLYNKPVSRVKYALAN